MTLDGTWESVVGLRTAFLSGFFKAPHVQKKAGSQHSPGDPSATLRESAPCVEQKHHGGL